MLEFHYQEKYVNVTFTNFHINSGKTGVGAGLVNLSVKVTGVIFIVNIDELFASCKI